MLDWHSPAGVPTAQYVSLNVMLASFSRADSIVFVSSSRNQVSSTRVASRYRSTDLLFLPLLLFKLRLLLRNHVLLPKRYLQPFHHHSYHKCTSLRLSSSATKRPRRDLTSFPSLLSFRSSTSVPFFLSPSSSSVSPLLAS